MFEKVLSNIDIDKEIKDKLNEEANTTVIKLTLFSAILGSLALAIVELFNYYPANWLRHVIFPDIAIVIGLIFICLLRKFRLSERVITHLISISLLAGVSIIEYAYFYVGGVTVWVTISILISVSMCYYSNGIVLIYAFFGGLGWIITFALYRPDFYAHIDMTDHVGRICIFFILCAMAFWVNRKLKKEIIDNHKKMRLIEDYSKELEIKNNNLQKLDKLKDEFLANTSHELKTPLHGIIGILEPLLQGNHGALTEEQRQDVTLAISSARRLSGLVGDILDFSKLKSKDIILKKQYINIFMLTDMVCKTFEHQIAKKSISLNNNIPPSFPLIYADENRFLQIMYNVVGNAVKFTDSGEITITAAIKEGYMHITVSDTGIGISKENLGIIFDAFEQADSSVSRNYDGTGLGLAITRSLVELHGGKVWVNSEPLKGSSFIFTFPLLEGENEVTPLNTFEQKINSETYIEDNIFKKKIENLNFDSDAKILVVDDEPINLQIMYNILSMGKHEIICVQSGKQALDLILGNEKFDLLILDIMMPQMSGFEVCRRVREIYTLTQLPILLVTAKNFPEDLVQGFEMGANDYLQKPFNGKELVARVQTLLELKKASELALSAELYFLQSQIKPHFLHNTLSTIMSFVRTNPEMARELLLELSNYLRESFNFNKMNSTFPLSKELSLIKSYLFIEKARFQDKLNYIFDIDENIVCNVPHLILQPIVENAVRHGILEKNSGGTVKISVKNYDNYVLLSVEDDGIGINKENIPLLLSNKLENVGIGLYNVHKRMLAIYGNGVDIESDSGNGTKICLKIPQNKED